jgi:hypothetical protein
VISWWERQLYKLVARILDGKTESIEEYVARVNAAVNSPESIEARRNLKPSFYISRSTGEMRRATEQDDLEWAAKQYRERLAAIQEEDRGGPFEICTCTGRESCSNCGV